MKDREAALVEAFKALLAERYWYEERFVQAMDEDGKSWSFGAEDLKSLAIHHYIAWTQGKRDAEPTAAMHKLVGQFLADILASNKPGPLITPHRHITHARHRNRQVSHARKNPPKPENEDMARGVAFFKRHHCEQADAVKLTARALGLQYFQHARIRKAYKDNKDKGLDAIDIMLEQATPELWK